MTHWHAVGRWVHLGSGFAAVGLGLAVMLLPKFGRRAGWHRWAGRVYAGLIGVASALGGVLAYLRGNTYLTILGGFTAAVVAGGWWAGVTARRRTGPAAGRMLRWHLGLMGSSYIGAWSGFFATNPVFGYGDWQVAFYVFGPPAVGGAVIAWAALKVRTR